MSELFLRIERAGHIVLIAHRNPDADSLGSASALYSYALRLQKRVSFYCVTERIDPRLAFLPWFEKVTSRFPADADLALSFDCASAARLGTEAGCEVINIDHHASNEKYGVVNIVDTTAISTSQVLYERFKEAEVQINPKMATALYAGLFDDSAGFTSAKTDRRAFAMAADLAGAGAEIAVCSRHLAQSVSLAATRLKGTMLRDIELLREGSVAYLWVDRELLQRTGAHSADCETALNEALYLPTVRTALLLREKADGSLKGSLRTRGEGDMSAVALEFGGGGHRHAAGFDVEGVPPETVRHRILELLE